MVINQFRNLLTVEWFKPTRLLRHDRQDPKNLVGADFLRYDKRQSWALSEVGGGTSHQVEPSDTASQLLRSTYLAT